VLLTQYLHGQSCGCLCFVFLFNTLKPQHIRRLFLLEATFFTIETMLGYLEKKTILYGRLYNALFCLLLCSGNAICREGWEISARFGNSGALISSINKEVWGWTGFLQFERVSVQYVIIQLLISGTLGNNWYQICDKVFMNFVLAVHN
jgi:hypothetical protein